MPTKKSYAHEWSLLCQRSIIDHDTNALSLIDTIEQVTIQVNKPTLEQGETPVFTIPIHVVSRVRKTVDAREIVSVECMYEMYNPERKKVGDATIVPFTMGAGMKYMRIRTMLGIPMQSSGEYTIHVNMRDVGAKIFTRAESVLLDVVLNG